MRVVFDSNIYISALVIPASQAERAFLKIVDGRDSLLISKAIIDEVLTVLSRKFRKDREALSRVAVYLSEIGEVGKPTWKSGILRDEPDNRILECAFAGKADLIVKGDKEIRKLRQYYSARIISLREYAADA
jgi:putative PIN family toxin of toxin-antitoxin system